MTFRHSERKQPPLQLRMKPWQWAVIVTEAVLLFGVLGALAWMLLLNPPGPVAQPQSAAHVETAAPAVAPTDTPAPVLLASSTPPPTRTPQPTNTRVVSRATVNQAAIDRIEQQVVILRGLKPRSAVQTDFLSRLEMVTYIRNQDEAIRNEITQGQALFRALGLIQPDTQIDQNTAVTITASSIAGFYDSKDKRLRVVSDLENMGTDERVTLAHEYTHALQDQYFDLAQYEQRIQTTDERLAMMAVPEGDATVVMSLYLYGNTAQSDWEYLAYRATFADVSTMITATGISTRTGQIEYFAYVQGAQFVAALVLDGKGWTEVNHTYADPPRTTSQVMHPASYLTRHATPVPVSLPDLRAALGKDWKRITSDTLGEYLASVHLDEFLNDPKRAEQAADGWEGDSFSLWHGPGNQQVFAWQIAWDTPRDVGEFFEAYSALLRKRAGSSLTVEQETADLRWYSGSAGSGLIRRIGEQTLVLWAPDRVTVEKLLALFR